MIKLRKIKCGKPGCKKCPHGAYVYAQWKEKGKVKEKYLGKYGEVETEEKIKDFAKKHPRILKEFENIKNKETEV